MDTTGSEQDEPGSDCGETPGSEDDEGEDEGEGLEDYYKQYFGEIKNELFF